MRTAVANVRTLDLKIIDDVFAMGGGYVLDFSNRTFADFFAEELNIDVDDPRYARSGTSKANRLRSLLKDVDLPSCLRVLETLWKYRQQLLATGWAATSAPGADGRFLDLLRRLAEPASPAGASGAYASAFALGSPPPPAFDRGRLEHLRGQYSTLAALPPHARGYAFERFLVDLFNAHGLTAREPFSLRGEQIDGSFNLANETYLLEAKWQQEPTGAVDLHAFHGKLEQKAVWARGLFVSHTGFTAVGLATFGKGKRVVCMDGQDITDLLRREIPLDRALELKVRRAAETGEPFPAVRDLFSA